MSINRIALVFIYLFRQKRSEIDGRKGERDMENRE